MKETDNHTNKEMLSQLMDGEWHELNPSDCVAAVCDDEKLRAKWARYHMIRDAMHKEPMQTDQSLVSRICDAIDDEPAYSNISSLSGAAVQPLQAGEQNTDASTSMSSDSDNGQVVAIDSAAAVKRPSWVNTGVAGLALAASVALVTVVSLNLVGPQTSSDVSTTAEAGLIEPGTAVVDSGAPLNDLGTFESGDRSVLPTVDFVSNSGAYWTSPSSSERVSDESRLNRMLSNHLEQAPTAVREGGLLPDSQLEGSEEGNQ